MHRPASIASTCIVAFCIASAAPANAFIVSGHFDGTITRVATPGGDSQTGVGDPVSGDFFFDTAYFTLEGGDGISVAEYGYFNAYTHAPSLSIRIGDLVEDLGAQTVRMTRSGGEDLLYLSNYYPGGYGSSLLLAGATGSLFDALSLDAIHSGPIDLAHSRAYSGSYLEDAGNAGSFISLNAADIAVNQTPEAPSLALTLLALVAAAAARGRGARSGITSLAGRVRRSCSGQRSSPAIPA